MLRSTTRHRVLTKARLMATDTSPPAGAASAPQSVPPSRSGFIRRALPLALLGGTGYVFYKGSTDPDFRASVENVVPGSARLFDMLPSPLPPPSFVTQTNKKEASAQMESNRKEGTTLPSKHDSVPDILLKIEESSPQKDKETYPLESKKRASEMQKDQYLLQSMTPTERAATKEKVMAAPILEAGDGPLRASKQVKSVSTKKPKAVEKPLLNGEKRKITTIDVDDIAIPDQKQLPANNSSAAKGKLARILGKGDFLAENVHGPDVVDDSEYKKPKVPSTETTARTGESKSKLLPNAQLDKVRSVSGGTVPDPEALEEVKALRAELRSQTKWEAVRLQEAVRSQMVEDKKATAKEIAAISQKHAEELARVREDAMNETNRVISERTLQLKQDAEKKRDADVGKLLQAKEDELRRSITLEFTNKEQQRMAKQERTLADVNAQVASMTSQFDALLIHAEKAREAAKRASHAFLLRESLGLSRPLRHQLSKASDESELGHLVKESIPDSACQKGVSSLGTLQADFSAASKRGLSVAMVPEGKTGTIWGHLLGAIFSRLKLPVDTRIESDASPKCNEDRIRLAQHFVREGDIGGAVSTLESLDGLSAEVMTDWLGAARARIAADLAAEVLLADAIIAQVMFTKGGDTDSVVTQANRLQ